jgi:hypothetical protein
MLDADSPHKWVSIARRFTIPWETTSSVRLSQLHTQEYFATTVNPYVQTLLLTTHFPSAILSQAIRYIRT